MAILNTKVGGTQLLFQILPNPTLKMKTESGILLQRSLVKSEETGSFEELSDQTIGFGIVTVAGYECKYIKEGDGIFFDRRSIRPVPRGEETWNMAEQNVIAYVEAEDPSLLEAFQEYQAQTAVVENDIKEQAKKSNIIL